MYVLFVNHLSVSHYLSLTHLFVYHAKNKNKNKHKTKELTILPTPTITTITATTRTPTPNTLSSSSPSSSIKCVSPHVVNGNNNGYVVFEAIYYDNGRSNGRTGGLTQNHSNQLVLAKVKSNNNNNNNNNRIANHNNNNNNVVATTPATMSVTKTEAKNVAAPILVTSTPLTSVLQCNSNTVSTVNCGTIVKKPSIILLTQASLSKLLSSSDLNMINNNNNKTNTNHNNNNNANIHNVNVNNATNVHVNHAHSHHQHDNSNRSKCNITINTTTTTNSNPSTVTQNNSSQLKSVLMINSKSTIETSAGIVTLTSTSAPAPLLPPPNRDVSDEMAKANRAQVHTQAHAKKFEFKLTIFRFCSIPFGRCRYWQTEIYQLRQNRLRNHRQRTHFHRWFDRIMRTRWTMNRAAMTRKRNTNIVKITMIRHQRTISSASY